MQHAVMRIGILLAAVFACSPLLAAGPYTGATAEQYDWQGTWDSSYKKEVTGRVGGFPWEFTRIKDTFHANFYFSVDANGNVRGSAYGSIFYRLETDGCASISHGAGGKSCVIRCKGNGVVEALRYCPGSAWPEPPCVFPDVYPLYFSDAIPVTGQVNGTTVHLKLGPPDNVYPFEISNTCVGPRGTQTVTSKMGWFCPAGSHLCSASGQFLEIDIPLTHEAAQPIHTAEVGGGLDGMVRIRRTCRNIADGDKGFIYVSANSTQLHKEPAANSPSVGGAPRGLRLLFTDTMQKNGARWYFIAPPGGNPGWVPSADVSCERPPPLPPGKPLKLKDTGLGNAHPTASMVAGANG